jgi:AcrR family transcriptional regulator
MASLPQYLSKVPVGREPLAREVIESHQRERIVEVAIEVFAKRGYRATTIDNITAAAQIGIGSFYALFDGKEECFLAAYDRILSDARASISAAVRDEADWPEASAAALRTLLELIAEHPHRARVALVEVQTAGAAALDAYEETLEELVPVLAEGRRLSRFGELPPSVEFAILSGIAWFLQQRIVLGELEELTAALPEVLEIVLAPYLGEDETARLATAQIG